MSLAKPPEFEPIRVQLGQIVSPGYALWSWAQIARGAVEAGRDPSDLDLASNVLVSVDRDAQAARDAVRHVLAYYAHRVEPIVLSTSGADPDEIERVRQAVLHSGVDAGAKLVTDHMIDTFAAARTPARPSTRSHRPKHISLPARKRPACPGPPAPPRPRCFAVTMAARPGTK